MTPLKGISSPRQRLLAHHAGNAATLMPQVAAGFSSSLHESPTKWTLRRSCLFQIPGLLKLPM
eukprot:CAMPEP_0170586678 /NCGR_PEP_ID=MMETSP0224-20130122/9873_1 /TAXON_ID=285029 /ORGANISM="Togula jolla, Strain CCCM 725" /LENGTH=62 /DNA_ID=CAMNT_0010910241 /DNA_START=10 /DNA_END=198 /DNA_ORIENTATION=+